MKHRYHSNLKKDLIVAKVLVNPLTKRRLDNFKNRPSHALLLSGQKGSGLHVLADQVRFALTADTPEADALVRIEPNEKGTIAIEDIRGLSKRLKLHNTNDRAVSVVVVIGAAEAMPTEAQNALLKLLEEPPRGVLFILLVHDTSKILATISSRSTHIDVLPVSLDQAQEFFKDKNAGFVKNYHLSGGLPALLYELTHQKDHPLVALIDDAKQLLTASSFERLAQVDARYKKREAATAITHALLRVCGAALHGAKASDRWVHNVRQCAKALKKLEANVQSKLVLDELFLNLR